VASVGFFDGVHIGHRHLIKQVKEKARELGLPSAIVTFPVHPRKVLQKNYQPALLCGYEEKLEQLSTTQIDYCISLPFTQELSRLSAREFMGDVLKKQIGVRTLFVGYDHRFGYNREEGFSAYQSYGEQLGIQVIQAGEYQVEGENVSSTKIRLLLKKGEIQQANSLLSYNYTLSGKIVEGLPGWAHHRLPYRKHTLLGAIQGLCLNWVYMPCWSISGILFMRGCSISVPVPPLHDDPEISVEVNIFDFSGDLYNQSLTVEFIDFIRADRKFDAMEELVTQIHKDKFLVQERLKNEK